MAGTKGAFTIQGVVDGRTSTKTVNVTADNNDNREPTVNGGQTGVLTTHSSGTAGTITTDQTIVPTTGARVHVYWNGGANMAVIPVAGTITGNAMPFTGATGDALPAQGTAVVIMVPDSEILAAVGDNVVGITAWGKVAGHVILASSGADLLKIAIGAAGEGYNWFPGNGVTNPVAGATIAKVYFSHAQVTAQDMRCQLLHN